MSPFYLRVIVISVLRVLESAPLKVAWRLQQQREVTRTGESRPHPRLLSLISVPPPRGPLRGFLAGSPRWARSSLSHDQHPASSLGLAGMVATAAAAALVAIRRRRTPDCHVGDRHKQHAGRRGITRSSRSRPWHGGSVLIWPPRDLGRELG